MATRVNSEYSPSYTPPSASKARKWNAWFEYEVTETASEYVISIPTAGFYINADLNTDIFTGALFNGETQLGTGSASISYSSSSPVDTTLVSDKSVTIAKSSEEQTTTISMAVAYTGTGISAWRNVSLTATLEFTIPKKQGLVLVKVSGEWVEGEVSVKVNGTWKTAESVSPKVSGEWKG